MAKDNFKQYIDDFFDDLRLYDDFHNGHHYKDLLKATIDCFWKMRIPIMHMRFMKHFS